FYVVCMAVFCERWAAAILGSSVVLMLCERYGYARADALRMAGLINAASYLATLPGGLAVDRWLSSHQTFGAGLALLALGYGVLTLSAPSALFAALFLLALGHALFKPSTQTLITRLYAQNDAGLDGAQISLYLAGNAGSTVGAGLTGLFMRNHAFVA